MVRVRLVVASLLCMAGNALACAVALALAALFLVVLAAAGMRVPPLALAPDCWPAPRGASVSALVDSCAAAGRRVPALEGRMGPPARLGLTEIPHQRGFFPLQPGDFDGRHTWEA